MKRLIFIILLVLPYICFSQTYLLKGIVWLNDENEKPLPNISIKGVNSNGMCVTTNSGEFELYFEGHTAGEIVRLIIDDERYEVKDKNNLTVVLRKYPTKDIIDIVMIDKEDPNYLKKKAPSLGSYDNKQYAGQFDLLQDLSHRINSLNQKISELSQKLEKRNDKSLSETLITSNDTIEKDAIELAFKNNYSESQAQLNKLDYLDSAREAIKKRNELDKESDSLNLIIKRGFDYSLTRARIFFKQKKWDSTYYYFEEAIFLDSTNFELLNEYASIRQYMGDNLIAREYFIKALNNSPSLEYTLDLITNILYTCSFLNDLDGAKYFYGVAKALVNSNIKINYDQLASINLNLAVAYHIVDSLETAINYYETSIKQFKFQLKDSTSLSSLSGLSLCFNNLGDIYLKLGNSNKAAKYYSKSINYTSRIDSVSNLITYFNLALPFENLGDLYFRKEKYNKALEIYNSSLLVRTDSIDFVCTQFQYRFLRLKYKIAKSEFLVDNIKVSDSISRNVLENYRIIAIQNNATPKEVLDVYDLLMKTSPSEYRDEYFSLIVKFVDAFQLEGDYNNAIKYLQTANNLMKKSNDFLSAWCSHRISYNYLNVKEVDSAKFYIKNAIDKLETGNISDTLAKYHQLFLSEILLGDIEYIGENYEKANNAYLTSIEIVKIHGNYFKNFNEFTYLEALSKSANVDHIIYEKTKDKTIRDRGWLKTRELEDRLFDYVVTGKKSVKDYDVNEFNLFAQKLRFYYLMQYKDINPYWVK